MPTINLGASFASIKTQLTEHFWEYFIASYDQDSSSTYTFAAPAQTAT